MCGLVDHVRHQTSAAEHLLPEYAARVVRVRQAPMMRVRRDDEKLIDQGPKRLGGQAGNLRAGRRMKLDAVSHSA